MISILYISNLRFPTRKAYGYQIAQQAAALAAAGVRVSMRFPNRLQSENKNAHAYYSLPDSIQVSYAQVPDAFRFQKLLGTALAFRINTSLFFLSSLFLQPKRGTVIFTRNANIAWVFSRRGYKTFYNAHSFPRHTGIHLRLLSAVSGIVANSSGTAEEYRKRIGAPVLTLPNAVDIERFDVVSETPSQLRTSLNLPQHLPIVMYVGHFYAWKGAGTLLDAARELPDVQFVLVGGLEEDIRFFEERTTKEALTNVQLLGYQPSSEIPKYMKAATFLVLPNSPDSIESERYTSPLKLFEYMATKVPILSSDLPSMREILSEDTATFFTAGDGKALAGAVRNALQRLPEAQEKARKAYEIVADRYTWSAAAQKLIPFMQ